MLGSAAWRMTCVPFDREWTSLASGMFQQPRKALLRTRNRAPQFHVCEWPKTRTARARIHDRRQSSKSENLQVMADHYLPAIRARMTWFEKW
jgi:hypothetical protein